MRQNVRRLWLGLVAGVLLLAGIAVPASPALAGDTWCDVDPPVILLTPAGNLVIVYVTDSGPLLHTASLLLPRITSNVQPANNGTATDVTLTVTVPNDLLGSHYGVASEVWSGPLRLGTRYARQTGYAGEPLQLHFTVNVP
jgi:hypothetical protein